MTGPLSGIRVVELGAIGPAPFGAMLLADLGAEVLRVDRIEAASGRPGTEVTSLGMARNRRSIALDLKADEGRRLLLELIDRADVFVEGFRPGVMERLGIGPEVCLERNPRLVYARMTGWGQEGPLARAAGHDLNFLAVAGALHPVGPADRPPTPPLNYVADFGGGGAYLAIGVLAALVERSASGQGQVLDVAMVDGAASLTAYLRGLVRLGLWSPERGANLLDGSAPFYGTYETADGRYVAVGAIEPPFYAQLLDGLGIPADELPQGEPTAWPREDWPAQRERIAAVFRTRTRDEWEAVFAGTDACVSPVLALDEAADHPHLAARGTYVEVDGAVEPAPAPRLSRTPGGITRPAPAFGGDTDEVLATLGYTVAQIADLRASGAVA